MEITFMDLVFYSLIGIVILIWIDVTQLKRRLDTIKLVDDAVKETKAARKLLQR